MDVSTTSLLTFIFTTIAYYNVESIGKIYPKLEDNSHDHLTDNLYRSILYFFVVVLLQYVINSVMLVKNCGGAIAENLWVAFIATFLPWTLIFGLTMATLIIFPALKNIFADVLGYFVVSKSANEILTTILKEQLVDDSGNMLTPGTEDQNIANSLMKLVGDKSLLINKMTPENFVDVWSKLSSLMKPEIANSGIGTDGRNYKDELFQLTILRDKVGEGAWYFYTAVLIISLVSFNLASVSCAKDINVLKQEQTEFEKNQEESKKTMSENTQIK